MAAKRKSSKSKKPTTPAAQKACERKHGPGAPECEKKIKPDWWCVAIDNTRYWNIAPEDKPKIERILSVYFYDKNEYTHLAELTPSYYMRALESVVVSNIDVDDAERERLYEKYPPYEGADNTYMHVRSVDQIADKWKYHYGATRKHNETTEEQEEEVRDYLQGNPPF